ncbi:MAG: basic secretory protein-like protein [Polyangiales bacterium]
MTTRYVMNLSAYRTLRLIVALCCSAAASAACDSEADTEPDGGLRDAGAGGASAADGGSAGGSAGRSGAGAVGGASGRSAGAGVSGGRAGGTGGSAGKSNAGAGGTVAAGSGGAGKPSAGAGGAGGSDAGDHFGVTTCQPAFESACKPTIELVNDDPNGRGKVFTDAVPDVETTLKDIACVVCSMLYRDPSEIPANKRPRTIKLILDTHGGVAQAGGGQIQFDLDYINSYADRSAADIKQEMLGVLQHETVHLYQHYGNNGTGEGLADLVRTRKGYYPRSRWRAGGSWKDAYTTSGFFYSWLTGPCDFHAEALPAHDLELPYKLNKALADKQGDAAYAAVEDLLEETFDRDVDSLWQEYQDTAF